MKKREKKKRQWNRYCRIFEPVRAWLLARFTTAEPKQQKKKKKEWRKGEKQAFKPLSPQTTTAQVGCHSFPAPHTVLRLSLLHTCSSRNARTLLCRSCDLRLSQHTFNDRCEKRQIVHSMRAKRKEKKTVLCFLWRFALPWGLACGFLTSDLWHFTAFAYNPIFLILLTTPSFFFLSVSQQRQLQKEAYTLLTLRDASLLHMLVTGTGSCAGIESVFSL